MAYIPPHKRHSKDEERSSPVPTLFVPEFEKKLNLRPSSSNSGRKKDKHTLQGGKVIYAKHAISKWCIIGSTDNDELPGSIRLEPISCKSVELRRGEKPLILACDHTTGDVNEITKSYMKSPLLSITEKMQSDILASFQNVRNEMDLENLHEVKPSFAARMGKIFFHGSPAVSLDGVSKSSTAETALGQVKRSFYTTVPISYMETILGVVPKIGVDFETEKDYYHVKVFDKSCADATISCKCIARKESGELELHKAVNHVSSLESLSSYRFPEVLWKIELNQVRHLVIDTLCVDKNLDLRLMLSTKRILTALTDDEKHSLKNLIKSAVVDPDVKGGLRWPLGKESSGGRYCIVGVWHTKVKAFSNPSMKLKLRHADRFDFRTSTGEVAREVTVGLTGISRLLRNRLVEEGSLTEMLQDILKLLWDHFLSHECSFT